VKSIPNIGIALLLTIATKTSDRNLNVLIYLNGILLASAVIPAIPIPILSEI